MMPYYVGIDGGGTKTAVELRTRGSAAHSRAVFGPLNCNSDRPAAAKALADMIPEGELSPTNILPSPLNRAAADAVANAVAAEARRSGHARF